MKFVLHAVFGAFLVLSAFKNVHAGSCSGSVGSLTLKEQEDSSNLYVSWSAPSGESGCTYTITYTSNAPNSKPQTYETEELHYTIDAAVLVPCSTTTISVRTSDGPAQTKEIEIDTRSSTAPLLLDMTTSCDSIEMTWEGQPYQENMCVHTHFQLFCLSDSHNFTVPQNVVDEENRIFHVRLTTVLRPDIYYTCNGYMFVTLAGFTPASEDIQFWSNLDTVRALEVSENNNAIRAAWEPPLNSEECGVGYKVTYENEVLGEVSEETTNLYLDLNAEIIPCTEYKISVTPISFTGSLGTDVSATYEPEVTQGSVADLGADDDGSVLTVHWVPINVGKCDIKFVVEHVVDGELKEVKETVGSSVEFERIPCTSNTFEVSVVTNGNPGVPVTLELNLTEEDITEISEVQNLQVSGNLATWEAPVTVGKCSSSHGIKYEVVHEGPLGTTSTVVDSTEATLTLIPCSENTVQVNTIAGSLAGSPAVVDFVADAVDLEAPENLRTIPDFTSAMLTMRAETKDINACPISEALITCSKDGDEGQAFGTSVNVVDNDERVFEVELSGLESDMIYNCLLRWSNSPMGQNIRFRTIPIPNKQLSVTDVTSEGFNVVWSEDYGEEFVLGYELVINSYGPSHEVKEGCDHETSNTFVFELGAGTENQVFVEGFPDYSYDVALKTTYNLGSLGVTDESDGLDVNTLTDVPGEPEDLGIEFVYEAGAAYNVTGLITWTAPCKLHGSLRSFGVTVAASFELGGSEQTLNYDLDINADSPNKVYSYELKDINPFFRYVVTINTLAAEEGPGREIIITPPDICSCTRAFKH